MKLWVPFYGTPRLILVVK